MKKGYSSTHISRSALSLPKLSNNISRGNKLLLDYTHFSICVNKQRCLPYFVAVNIDGSAYKPSKRTRDIWSFDKSIPDEFQLGKKFYQNTDSIFHKGHLVRRLDPCWGKVNIRKKAEKDTFYFTNCSPQHKQFNPCIWLELEKHVLEKGALLGKLNISVFSGPILSENDKIFYKPIDNNHVQIPIVFWKVIVWKKSDNSIYAVGFMQSQWQLVKHYLREKDITKGLKRARWDENSFENLEFKNKKTYQVPISMIEKYSGLKFSWPKVKFPFNKNRPNELKTIKKQYDTRSGRLHYRGAKKVVEISNLVM